MVLFFFCFSPQIEAMANDWIRLRVSKNKIENGELIMSKFLKIAVVSFAVLSGISAANAGNYDQSGSVIDQILAEQQRSGN